MKLTSSEAERDCRDLVVRSIRALDVRDYDVIVGSFALDGAWDRAGELLVGPAAVREALDKRPANLVTQHLISNLVVDFATHDSATVSYTLSAYAQLGAAPYHLHAIFKASDRLVQTSEGWKFAHRGVEPAFASAD